MNFSASPYVSLGPHTQQEGASPGPLVQDYTVFGGLEGGGGEGRQPDRTVILPEGAVRQGGLREEGAVV